MAWSGSVPTTARHTTLHFTPRQTLQLTDTLSFKWPRYKNMLMQIHRTAWSCSCCWCSCEPKSPLGVSYTVTRSMAFNACRHTHCIIYAWSSAVQSWRQVISSVLVLVLKDALRTIFEVLVLSLFLRVRPSSLSLWFSPCPYPCRWSLPSSFIQVF